MLESTFPIVCLITSGEASSDNFHTKKEEIAALAAKAAECGADIFQIREKTLSARLLCELVEKVVRSIEGSDLKVVVNDRADVAAACGAAGVHLTSASLACDVVRNVFGSGFVIGCSAHSADEVQAARDGGADYAFFSPVFETPSKSVYGPPKGVERLGEVARRFQGFPVIALGGIGAENFESALESGASGVAAIRMFSDTAALPAVIAAIKSFR